MDDQAEKLRQLVRHVRHAASVATGPPSLLVYASRQTEAGERFAQQLATALADRSLDTDEMTLTQLTGPYNTADLEQWQRASMLVVVVDDQQGSIIGSYAALKLAQEATPLPVMELVVCVTQDLNQASQAADRLFQTCQRFLHCSFAESSMVTSDETQQLNLIESLLERMQAVAPRTTNTDHSPIASLGT